ncbi:MAG: hypothetical protein Q8O15_08700 [Rectinemataceae bacterium]|nr:hypothetical protein [Rectinemataceae bacterium]
MAKKFFRLLGKDTLDIISDEELYAELKTGIKQFENKSLIDFEDFKNNVSKKDWKAIQGTLYLLSIPGMRDSIIDGMNEPLPKSAQ